MIAPDVLQAKPSIERLRGVIGAGDLQGEVLCALCATPIGNYGQQIACQSLTARFGQDFQRMQHHNAPHGNGEGCSGGLVTQTSCLMQSPKKF